LKTGSSTLRTISDRNLERVKALGGAIAIQASHGLSGRYFMERYGKKACGATPPVRRMLELGIPVARAQMRREWRVTSWFRSFGW